MADKNDKIPGNVPGPFYVDTSCIDCDMCREIAPQFFKRNDDLGQSMVYQQPQTPEEFAEATAAMHQCPTDTIGNDG